MSKITENLKSQVKLFSLRDLKIFFEPEQHVYYINVDDKLTKVGASVSEYITKKLFSPFKDGEILDFMTRRGKNRNLIVAEWRFAAFVGHVVHSQIENFYINIMSQGEDAVYPRYCTYKIDVDLSTYGIKTFFKSNENITSEEENLIMKTLNINKAMRSIEHAFNNFKRNYNNELYKYKCAAVEYMIYDEKKDIAGMVDAVFYESKENMLKYGAPDDKPCIFLVDWKTNAKLTDQRAYPIENRDSPFYMEKKNKLEKYYCQLHTYSNILEDNYNVFVSRSMICHVPQLNVVDDVSCQNPKILGIPSSQNCPCKTI